MRSIAFLPSLLLCSCAAMMTHGPSVVPIDSRPQGAIVSYRGHDMGRTPCCVPMQGVSTVTLRLEGHHARQVDVGTVSNADLVLAGILFFGPFELLFDLFNNAWTSVDGNPVLVELAPDDGAPLPMWERPVRPMPSWIGGEAPSGGMR